MNTKEISFDVSAIVLIELHKECINEQYQYYPKMKLTICFGLLGSKLIEAGYYGGNPWYYGCRSADNIINAGYKIVDNVVYEPANVILKLNGGHEVSKRFECDAEASSWIADLKACSGKSFKTIIK